MTNKEQLAILKQGVAARDKGVLCSEGKKYIVKDGDCMLFRFNV